MIVRPYTHEVCCRIARGGEGAIVAELLMLSKQCHEYYEHIQRLQEKVNELADKVYNLEKKGKTV